MHPGLPAEAASNHAHAHATASHMGPSHMAPVQGEGILRYTHSHSIQCLAYNPVTHHLASATAVDLGLWSLEEKNVNKLKVPACLIKGIGAGVAGEGACAQRAPAISL